MIDENMGLLKQKLTDFAFHVEKMIEGSIKGLLEKNGEMLNTVFQGEGRANDFEIEIEELAIETIAKYEPKAKNLRTILMILKINNDLERIGDHAVNISESALFLIDKPPVKPLVDIPRMAEESINMLRDSVKAFIDEDPALARSVCKNDEIVDHLRDQVLRELITYMVSDPTTIERSIHLIRIAQNLERIADLSTNVSEDVIYMVEGKIIKHHKED